MVCGKCEQCKQELTDKQKRKRRRFCSHACANTYSGPSRRVKRIERVCQICSKKTYFKPGDIKVRERDGIIIKYCSQECSFIGKKTGKNIICPVCGKLFYSVRSRYCCVRCAGTARTNKYKGRDHGFWYENGYKVLYLDNNNSIKEHIQIMENHIGRKLYKNEIVHHVNKKKDDNRIENLLLMTTSEHSSMHRKEEFNNGKRLFTKECVE